MQRAPRKVAYAAKDVFQPIRHQVHKTVQHLRPRKSNIYDEYTKSGEPWIGLAISGGVDSMALAAVCSDLQFHDRQCRNAFKAFIVDHGVRKGSSSEAANVANELQRLGIPTQILTLDWKSSDPHLTTNFETMARRMRYRALGRACRDARIGQILVAHHADDQAETVLSRIHAGYMGTGLLGMRPIAKIPECEGIFGVDGYGRKPDEVGGITTLSRTMQIHRPLLQFSKQSLIELCKARGVRWFEDHTNKDKTLTVRNTIRSLSGGKLLPAALDRDNMSALAKRINQKQHQIEMDAKRLFDAMPITLDPRTGTATVDVCHRTIAISSVSEQDSYHLKATLLRKLLLLVSPVTEISLQDLDKALDFIFAAELSHDTHGSKHPEKIQIAGVNIERRQGAESSDCDFQYTLTRAIPTKHQADVSTPISCIDTRSGPRSAAMDSWILWDGRYWMRLHPLSLDPAGVTGPQHERPKGITYVVRFLTPSLLSDIRIGLRRRRRRRSSSHLLLSSEPPDLETCLARVPLPQRWTVPVIVARLNGEEGVVSMPTLHWFGSGHDDFVGRNNIIIPRVSLLYKHVEFRETEKHKIVSENLRERWNDLINVNYRERTSVLSRMLYDRWLSPFRSRMETEEMKKKREEFEMQNPEVLKLFDPEPEGLRT